MRIYSLAVTCLLLTSAWGCEPESTSRAGPEPGAHQHAEDKQAEPSGGPHPDGSGRGSAESERPGNPRTASEAQAAAPGCGDDPEGCGCGREPPQGDVPPRTRKDPATGRTVTVVGSDLKGAEAVTVSALVTQPERFAGKTVQVSGDVTAMCTHRRAWFAVREQPGDAQYVRVLTAPTFLVPPHAVGTKTRAEGRVDVIEVPEPAARHYARDHRLGEPNEVRGTRKSVVIRATGAEFL